MSRDDMVFVPGLGRETRASAPVRARQDRRLAGGKKKRGIFRRIAQARMLKRAARRKAAKSSTRRVTKSRGAAAVAGRTGARAAVFNPIGAVVTGLLVAGAVTLRLATGQSFENMGEQLNKMLLGDLDDEARAKMTTRRQLSGDPEVARIVGQEGRVNSQIQQIGKDLYDVNLRDEIGASLIRGEKGMQSNSTLDILIVRARTKFMEAWKSNGGPANVEEFREKYKKTLLAAGKEGR